MQTVLVPDEKYKECLFWCLDNLGPTPVCRNGCERWGVDSKYGWKGDEFLFYFRDDKDATLFILRWS